MALPIETTFHKMKKNILLFSCTALFFIAFTACSDSASSEATADSSVTNLTPKDSTMVKQTAAVYTCKMHPEVSSDKPGKCPKCGMDLIKKEVVKKDSTMEGRKIDSSQ